MSLMDCCLPMMEDPLGEADAARLADRFRALSDPTRVRLLSLIADRGEVCACELVGSVSVSQPTLSHHLKSLFESGLLDRERRGRWVYYRVRDSAVLEMHEALALPSRTTV